MTLEGIDVSVFQGAVNWPSVAASGVLFAICRATVGLGTDPSFLTNARGARASGLLVGAYHAFETAHDPVDQAKHFGAVAAGVLDLAPFLDFEGGTKGIDQGHALYMAQAFCDTADTLFVKTCGVYTFPFFWNGLTKGDAMDAAWCADRPFWLASYPGRPNPTPLAPFASTDMHQYTDTGTVPGIHGPVDCDRFYGALEDLRLVGEYMPGPTSSDITLPSGSAAS